MRDLTLTESIIALGKALLNLGVEIKYSIFRVVYKIIFLYSISKYELNQYVWIWGTQKRITKIYRDWEDCTFFYKLANSKADVSEGLLDFYKDKHEQDKRNGF
jgi:hypothetical protein